MIQNEKDFEDILAYISQFEYLNTICILLKPNEERLNVLFHFCICIKELLRYLFIHARENIMFILANARATNFEPGSSALLLGKLLQTLKDPTNGKVPFSRESSFFPIMKMYHRRWKVRATHIMLDCRTTIVAFIACTDLHAATTGTRDHANFVWFYKTILN